MQNNTSFSIAIDGPAGAGKSTIARALARSMNAMYLDTGAMYRAIGLHLYRAGTDLDSDAAIAAGVNDVPIAVRFLDGEQHIFLDGEDVSRVIREPEVSLLASRVSSVAEVRTRMVALQQEIARGQNVVMDGRDIGTKVLPHATLKIYLDASPEERARRRCAELKEKGLDEPYEKVLSEINARDDQDMHRKESPLTKAADAVTVDSSVLTPEAVVAVCRALAEQAILRQAGDGRRLLGLIGQRRSYRGAYRNAPVPRTDLEAILSAGLAAPSGCNKQTVKLIAVDDPGLLARLRSVIDPPRGETAPALILVLTRPIVAYRGRCFNVQDYAAAIENMLLAAQALGYASCWYEGHITDEDRIGEQMARILGVPEEYALVCMLPIGVPAEDARGPRKQPFGERVGFNAFPGEAQRQDPV